MGILAHSALAFADLSGPMLSGNRHQARGGSCGELTRHDQIAEFSPIGLFLVVGLKFDAPVLQRIV